MIHTLFYKKLLLAMSSIIKYFMKIGTKKKRGDYYNSIPTQRRPAANPKI